MFNKKMLTLSLLAGVMATGLVSAQPPKDDGDVYEAHLSQVAKADRRFKMPGQETIAAILEEFCSSHFVRDTKLAQTLAGRELAETGIYMDFALAYADYTEQLKEKKTPTKQINQIMHTLDISMQGMIDALVKASEQL